MEQETKKREMKVWIVEMLNDTYTDAAPKWESTVGCALTMADGMKELQKWKDRNSGRFRLQKYVRTSSPAQEKN